MHLKTMIGIGALALTLAGGAAALGDPADAATPTCKGKPATIVLKKSQVGQTVEGTDGRDVVAGTAGDDRFDPKGGNDLVCMGRGNGGVFGSAGDDVILGGGGSDALNGGDGNDQLLGQGGNDRLFGGANPAYTEGLCNGGKGTDQAPDVTGPTGQTPNGCDTLVNIP